MWYNIQLPDPWWIRDAGEYAVIDGETWHIEDWHEHIENQKSNSIAKYLCCFDDDGQEPSINRTPVYMPPLSWHRHIDRPDVDEIPF